MIVVFISHTHPPLVFETTSALLVAHATETAASSRTLPKAGRGLDFETAWINLTEDMKAAHHFPDLATARAHFERDDQMALHPRTVVLSALDRLEQATRRREIPSGPP